MAAWFLLGHIIPVLFLDRILQKRSLLLQVFADRSWIRRIYIVRERADGIKAFIYPQ
jgi:hypothetical protein